MLKVKIKESQKITKKSQIYRMNSKNLGFFILITKSKCNRIKYVLLQINKVREIIVL
jgi:hypothetical protein